MAALPGLTYLYLYMCFACDWEISILNLPGVFKCNALTDWPPQSFADACVELFGVVS